MLLTTIFIMGMNSGSFAVIDESHATSFAEASQVCADIGATLPSKAQYKELVDAGYIEPVSVLSESDYKITYYPAWIAESKYQAFFTYNAEGAGVFVSLPKLISTLERTEAELKEAYNSSTDLPITHQIADLKKGVKSICLK